MSTPWLLGFHGRPDPRLRVFCFPHAGAGAAAYRMWGHAEPAWIEFRAFQPPGRGSRLREAPIPSVDGIVDQALGVIRPFLDRPFALFGHSMGAWVAFEVARRLEGEDGAVPERLLVSGRRAPHLPSTDAPVSHFGDERFLKEVNRRYGGIPAPILSEPELLEIILPAMRADVRALEDYRFLPGDPLQCGISAFGGRSDEQVPLPALEAWSALTLGGFSCRQFPGGHFFLEGEREPLLREIVRLLDPGEGWGGEKAGLLRDGR